MEPRSTQLFAAVSNRPLDRYRQLLHGLHWRFAHPIKSIGWNQASNRQITKGQARNGARRKLTIINKHHVGLTLPRFKDAADAVMTPLDGRQRSMVWQGFRNGFH